MHEATAHQLIQSYVQGWRATNRELILSTLDLDCVIIESYGPTYRGRDMIARWIDSWFAPGNIVTRWDITSFFATDEACFFEWTFECRYAGDLDGFEGAPLVRVNQGKILHLREYATTAPRYQWDG